MAYAPKQGSPAVAALLSIVCCPGLGHVYAGDAGRGLVAFVVMLGVNLLIMFVADHPLEHGYTPLNVLPWSVAASFLAMDAAATCRRENAKARHEARSHGRGGGEGVGALPALVCVALITAALLLTPLRDMFGHAPGDVVVPPPRPRPATSPTPLAPPTPPAPPPAPSADVEPSDEHEGPASEAPDVPAKDTETGRPHRERTPDERARSAIGLAESYADNGRDAAEKLAPSSAVLEAIGAARQRIKAAMRRQ